MQATANLDEAYASRTRLRRALLVCSQELSLQLGLPAPRFPSYVSLPAEAPTDIQKAAGVCNRIAAASHSLCQPSEPLDDRWRNGWRELRDNLEELSAAMKSVASK